MVDKDELKGAEAGAAASATENQTPAHDGGFGGGDDEDLDFGDDDDEDLDDEEEDGA